MQRSSQGSAPPTDLLEELQGAVRLMLRGGTLPPLLPQFYSADQATVDTQGRAASVAEFLMLATVQVSLLNRAGKGAEGAELARRLEQIAASADGAEPDALSDLLPSLRLRWAAARELAGNGPVSTVRQHHCRAVETALDHALAGEAALARAALNAWQEQQRAQPWSRSPCRAPALVARALLELETADIAGAAVSLDELGEMPDGEAFWAAAAFARAQWALLAGKPWQGLELLERVRAPHARRQRQHAASEALVVAATIDLECAAGRGNRAHSAVEAYSGDHPLVRVAGARLALLAGDSDAALTEAMRLKSGGDPSPRVLVDVLLIEAVAHSRAGREDEALAAWARALAVAEVAGAVRPFATLPQSAVEELIAIGAATPETWPARARQISVFPDRVDVVHLTGREHTIISWLARNPKWSLNDISAQSGVSPNTVKSQMRSLYRKLNVHTRQDAVRTAIALGIVRA